MLPKSRGMRNSVRPGARLLGKVVGHLEVDVIGRDGFFAAQLSSMISTSSSEMSMHKRSFQRSSNQLASLVQASWSRTSTFSSPCLRQPGQREVAAAEVADLGIDRVRTKQEIEFGVERVAQEQLDDDLPGSDLGCQAAQTGFIVVGRDPDRQLVAEVLRRVSA